MAALILLDAFHQMIEDLRAYLVLILWLFLVRGCAIPLREDPGGGVLHALPEAPPLRGLLILKVVNRLELWEEGLVSELNLRRLA